MKYYTTTIPPTLAEKLKEKGMPIDLVQHDVQGMIYADYAVTYASTFDWLLERGWLIDIGREYDFAAEEVTERFEWGIMKVGCFSSQPNYSDVFCDTWHEAANAAIEKALTLI